MLNQRLMPVFFMATMDMDSMDTMVLPTTDMPTMVTMDIDMPTMDTMDTHMPTMDTTDIIINLFSIC